MKVRVVAPFELQGQATDGTLELSEGSRVRHVLNLATQKPILARFLPVTVNGKQASLNHRLHEGDVVMFIMLISGG